MEEYHITTTSLISILLTLNCLWLSMCCSLMKHNWDYITKSCILDPKSGFITKSNMRLQDWKRSSINSHILKWIHTKKWLQDAAIFVLPHLFIFIYGLNYGSSQFFCNFHIYIYIKSNYESRVSLKFFNFCVKWINFV